MWRIGVGKASRATGLALCVVALTAGLALAAAKPVAGASYSGKTQQAYPQTVSFKVSANGKRVTKLLVPVELGCQGGGLGPPKPGTAKITAKHTFKVTLYLRNPSGAATQEKETVTGTFGKHRKESGTIKSVFTFGGCGTTVKYSTKAS